MNEPILQFVVSIVAAALGGILLGAALVGVFARVEWRDLDGFVRSWHFRLARKFGEPCNCMSARGVSAPLLGAPVWHEGHWSPALVLLDAWKNRGAWGERFESLRARLFGANFYGGTRFPAGEPKPRTCSYCGSAHPDDVLALVRRGWKCVAADDCSKWYIEPPSTMRSPVPPVKLRTFHCTTEQGDALDDARGLPRRRGRVTQ